MLTDWVHIGEALVAAFAGILVILFLVVHVEQWLESAAQPPARQTRPPPMTPLSADPAVDVATGENAA